MNRFFFTQKQGQIEQIGLVYAPNRYLAAQLFAIRKALKVKDFLKIYTVYNTIKPDININKAVAIKYEGETIVYFKQGSFIKANNKSTNPVLKEKFTIKKFIQFLNWIEKEDSCVLVSN